MVGVGGLLSFDEALKVVGVVGVVEVGVGVRDMAFGVRLSLLLSLLSFSLNVPGGDSGC